MNTKVIIEADLDDHIIEEEEVLELAYVIADSYPEKGTYVASFGFLTYEVKRGSESCVVTVTNGYGYHSWVGGLDMNHC